MKHLSKARPKPKTLLALLTVGVMLLTGSYVSAEYLINNPDGRMLPIKEGTFQPDLSPYMSKLPEVKILDRRFCPKHQQWAANEEFLFSQEGLSNMVRAAVPLAHNSAFIWLTNQQMYWSARNNLGFGFAASHAGINMVQGPYWTLKALEMSKYTYLQRDRGERRFSNKDVMLKVYFPMYWKVIGIPRFPDDGNPAYLEFECGLPYFIGPTPVSDTFDDPQSGKEGKWGVPAYFWDNRQWQWDRDDMLKLLDMGGIGIMLKRASMWVDYMWKGTHSGLSPSTQQKKMALMGNDVEEGFRGMALATTRINQALALKTQLVADLEGNLGGINPKKYDPANGLRYFPHKIWPNMLLAGDLPERQWAFDIHDPRSLLYDQGALLWGLSHLYQSTFRMTQMFTDNPPVDGGLMEKQLGVVPHYLANMVLKNIMAMHTRDGLLVSEWQPRETKMWVNVDLDNPGRNETVNLTDMQLVFLGAHEYIDRMRDPLAHVDNPNIKDSEPELTKKAEKLMLRNADFLLDVQGDDGSFCESYNVVTKEPAGPCNLSRPNFQAIGTLTQIYQAAHAIEDLDEQSAQKYAEAARKTWNHLWKNYWHEPTGLFRSTLGSDTVRIHALDIATQVRAWREILFTTPLHLSKPLIDKFNRWAVQTLMLSGMIQSEENRSGELSIGVGSRDWDNDGVPWLGKGPGDYGIAPVLAHEVAVNIGAPGQNEAFNALDGERHSAEQYGGDIRYNYQPLPRKQAVQEILLPVKLNVPRDEDGFPKQTIDPETGTVVAGWTDREPMLRWDGITVTLPPAKVFTRGSDLSGQQIFEMNCAHCHGYAGEGITGIPFDSDSLARTRDDMFEVPNNGRFTRLMPEWGLGHQDAAGQVLTDDEIYRIVDYIQSPEFQQLFVDTQNGIHYPTQPPRDAYFYISRAYVRGKQTPATEADIALVMNAQMEAIRTGKKVDIIQRLIEAERKREQREPAVADVPVIGTIISWFYEDEGDQAEIMKVENWSAREFQKVVSYTNDDQLYYAQKPVEFPEVAVAEADQSPDVKQANSGPTGQLTELDRAYGFGEPETPDSEQARSEPPLPADQADDPEKIQPVPIRDGSEGKEESQKPDLEASLPLAAGKRLLFAQSFDQDQYDKVLSYNLTQDSTTGGEWPYGLSPEETTKQEKARIAKEEQERQKQSEGEEAASEEQGGPALGF